MSGGEIILLVSALGESSPAPQPVMLRVTDPGGLALTLPIFVLLAHITYRLTKLAWRTRLAAFYWAAGGFWAIIAALVVVLGAGIAMRLQAGALLPPGGLYGIRPEARVLLSALMATPYLVWAPFTNYTFRAANPRFWRIAGASLALGYGGAVLVGLDGTAIFHPLFAHGPGRYLFAAGALLGIGWMGYESRLYWVSLRAETLEEDLDPVVVNRFFVWTLASAALAAQVVMGLLVAPNVPMAEQDTRVVLLFIATSVSAFVALYFGLAPPQWYRNRLARTGI